MYLSIYELIQLELSKGRLRFYETSLIAIVETYTNVFDQNTQLIQLMLVLRTSTNISII